MNFDLFTALETIESTREDLHGRCKTEIYRGMVRLFNGVRILFSNGYLTKFERTPTEVVMVDKQFTVKRCWQDYYQTPYLPVLFVPPLMVTPQIYDLRPRHSFVRHLLNYDFDIFILDFGAPTRKDKHISLNDYVRNIDRAIRQVLEITGAPKVSLIGYSMGGIFSNIYASQDRDRLVKNLVALGSPCDIDRWPTYGELAKKINSPINTIADMLEGVPPTVSRTIFQMMKPLNTITLPVNLMFNLWDEDFVSGYEAMERWFDDFVAYPRDAFKQFFNEVVTQNKLYLGELNILGDNVDLQKIECSYLTLAGLQDFLGHPDSVRPIMGVISSKDKTYHEVQGGHLGMLAGKTAPDTWEYIAKWLIPRSIIKVHKVKAAAIKATINKNGASKNSSHAKANLRSKSGKNGHKSR